MSVEWVWVMSAHTHHFFTNHYSWLIFKPGKLRGHIHCPFFSFPIYSQSYAEVSLEKTLKPHSGTIMFMRPCLTNNFPSQTNYQNYNIYWHLLIHKTNYNTSLIKSKFDISLLIYWVQILDHIEEHFFASIQLYYANVTLISTTMTQVCADSKTGS